MIRNMKAFGLAVVAVLAMGAISASAASAASFHSEVEPTSLKATGEGNQVFVTPAGTVTCTGVTGDATMPKKTEEKITATGIVYTGAASGGKCITKTIFGNVEVSINFTTNECDYVFHSNGEVDIECKAGTSGILISGPGCNITVGTQTGLKTATYDNKEAGTKRDITITANVTGISGSASGFLCSKEGAFTTGEYTGNVTVQGFEDKVNGAQVGIWWE